MKTLLETLEKNIEAEIEVQTGIQALLDQQLEILLRGRTNKLAAVLENAEQGLAQSQALERARATLIGQIGERLGVPAKEVSIQLIAERIGTDAASLTDRGAELKALVERIRERNRQVGLLLRHSVLFIDDLVRAVTGGASGAPTYSRDGTMQARGGATVVAEA